MIKIFSTIAVLAAATLVVVINYKNTTGGPSKELTVIGGLEINRKATTGDQMIIADGLILDLNANYGVITHGIKVFKWENQVKSHAIKSFQNKGKVSSPTLKLESKNNGGNNAVVFDHQSLVCLEEGAADYIVKGSGYTWLSIMSVKEQNGVKQYMQGFFGNIGENRPFFGIMAGFKDDNTPWLGARIRAKKPETFWNQYSSPYAMASSPLETDKYYIIIGRMSEGTDNAQIDLFVNSGDKVNSKNVRVYKDSTPSSLTIGKLRPTFRRESFIGEISRFLLYDRPLETLEINENVNFLINQYSIDL